NCGRMRPGQIGNPPVGHTLEVERPAGLLIVMRVRELMQLQRDVAHAHGSSLRMSIVRHRPGRNDPTTDRRKTRGLTASGGGGLLPANALNREEHMELAFGAADAAFRDEVRSFLDEKLTPELRSVGRRMTSVYADYDTTMT